VGEDKCISFGIFLNNDIRKLIGMQGSRKLLNNMIAPDYERKNWQ
jgi:hypothetical protein